MLKFSTFPVGGCWGYSILGAVHKLCCLKGGGGGQKLPILLSKKTTKRGGGAILRRHSVWTTPYCFQNWFMKLKFPNLLKPLGTIIQQNYCCLYPSEVIYFAPFTMILRHPVLWILILTSIISKEYLRPLFLGAFHFVTIPYDFENSILAAAKGQTISEWIYEVIVSP